MEGHSTAGQLQPRTDSQCHISIAVTSPSEEHFALLSVAEMVKARIKFSAASTRETTFTILAQSGFCPPSVRV